MKETKNFTSAKHPILFALSSLAVSVLGTLWFVMCFTAAKEAWWNSLYIFFVIFAVAVVLALRGIRSVTGILAVLLALTLLALTSIFIYGQWVKIEKPSTHTSDDTNGSLTS